MNDRAPDIARASARACIVAASVAAAEVFAYAAFTDLGRDHWSYWGLLFLAAGLSFVWALAIAVLHLLIAIPLYLALRRRGPVGTGVASACGFLIGAVPTVLLYGLPNEGLSEDRLLVLVMGVPGLAAGFAFGRDMNRDRGEPRG